MSTGMIQRRRSRQVCIGNVQVGGDAPISVQSMTTTRTENVAATVRQARALAAKGCEIIRVAVPTRRAAVCLAAIRQRISIPLVADIHFDARLALAAIEQGVDAVRINPGNLRRMADVKSIVLAAKNRGIPIRIGVNSGSIRPRTGHSDSRPMVELMVDAALRYCEQFETWGFRDIKLSLKASSVAETLAAYRAVARACDYPLHLGVTAAGAGLPAIVKSAIGIGSLLAEGIGDTIRVSLTGPPAREVQVGWSILEALGLRRRSAEIIACPTCGRCQLDLIGLVREVQQRIGTRASGLRIAIMGCIVNGPGEAREADVGIAGGKASGLIFRHGKPVRRVPADRLVDELLKEIQAIEAERTSGVVATSDYSGSKESCSSLRREGTGK